MLSFDDDSLALAYQNYQRGEIDTTAAMKVAIQGNLLGLPAEQILSIYIARSVHLGIDPTKKPFDLIEQKKDNKVIGLTLYANKVCAEELRKIHGVTAGPPKEEVILGNRVIKVTVELKFKDRTEFGVGCVDTPKYNIGDAVMKAHTKALRRGTFQLLGLQEYAAQEPDSELVPVTVEEDPIFLSKQNLADLVAIAKENNWKSSEVTQYFVQRYTAKEAIPMEDYDAIAAHFAGPNKQALIAEA